MLLLHVQRRAPVLARVRLLDDAAQLVRHQLLPITDAEHGHAQLVDARIDARRAFGIHARGPAREHDAARRERADLRERPVRRLDLAVDALLADAARDQLAVLGAEIEDQDSVGVEVGGHWGRSREDGRGTAEFSVVGATGELAALRARSRSWAQSIR